MDETGIFRFPGNLDPRAQEFRPSYPNHHHHLTLFIPPPPPPIYYPYAPTHPSAAGGVGYHQFPIPPPAYVSSNSAHEPLPLAPLPQPLATPSRTLLLSSVPTDVSESTVRGELEVFGDVRAVQMERLVCEGLVTVHFYDLRHAQMALTEIQEQHMQQQCRLRNHYNNSLLLAASCNNSVYGVENFATPLPPPARGLISGQAVWAQFIVPTSSCIPNGHNQGTIVVFNLDSNVSTCSLKVIFEAFGSVKELRETPLKRHQKFVEFYDVRDAAKALIEMNGKEIHGNHVWIEFSRPGGQIRKFFNPNSSTTTTSPTVSTTNSVIDFSSNNNYQTRSSITPPRRKCSSSKLPPRSYLCQTPQSTNKSKGNAGGNCKSWKTTGAVEASMASLCLIDDGSVEKGIEERIPNGITRKNATKSNNGNKSSTTTTTTIAKPTRSRPTKGRFKNFDPRFLINEDAILESNRRDSRTTVMIKNIPNKYSLKLILNMLDNHCIHCNEQIAEDGDDQPLSSYDFLYLPIDFNNKCNVGYGFVNMTSPEATWRLYKAFHLQSWEVFNSRKICHVTYARVQGLEALKEHFKNSKFPSVTEEVFPVVFSPPRDGRHLSDPVPIFGHAIPPPPARISTITRSDDLYEMDGSDWPAQEDDGSGHNIDVTIITKANELDGGHTLENGEADDDDDEGNNSDEEEGMGYCDSRSRSGGDYGDNDENSSWQ